MDGGAADVSTSGAGDTGLRPLTAPGWSSWLSRLRRSAHSPAWMARSLRRLLRMRMSVMAQPEGGEGDGAASWSLLW